jgi:uncharacterized protein YciI
MFVISSVYLKPLEEMDRLRPAHLEFLDKYYAKGIFLASGRQVPPKGGMIIAQGVSRAELEGILKDDPFQQQGAAVYEIVEFNATKYAPALEPLLKLYS